MDLLTNFLIHVRGCIIVAVSLKECLLLVDSMNLTLEQLGTKFGAEMYASMGRTETHCPGDVTTPMILMNSY